MGQNDLDIRYFNSLRPFHTLHTLPVFSNLHSVALTLPSGDCVQKAATATTPPEEEQEAGYTE